MMIIFILLVTTIGLLCLSPGRKVHKKGPFHFFFSQVFLLTSRSDFCRGKDMNNGASYFRCSLLSFMCDLSKETQDKLGCGSCS